MLLSSVLYVPFRYGQISHESFGVPNTRNRFPRFDKFCVQLDCLRIDVKSVSFRVSPLKTNKTDDVFSAENSAIKCVHAIAHTGIFLGGWIVIIIIFYRQSFHITFCEHMVKC